MASTINGTSTGSGGLITSGDDSGILNIQTNEVTAITIDASQNVGIGVTPSAWALFTALQIGETGCVASNAFSATNTQTYLGNNAYYNAGGFRYIATGSATALYNITANEHKWNSAAIGTAGDVIAFTNTMTLDSSGNLLVGTTTASGIITAKQTSLNAVISVDATNAAYNATLILGTTTRAASASFDSIGIYANSVAQFRVSGSGVIYAQNTAVQAISDQRLKENIRDSSDGLSVINGLRPVRYDWKEGFGNDRKDQLGFIAQEVEAVFPEAVSEWKVNKEDETVYKTVGPSAFIPVLVKAIQEQQAIIETLTQRITALEGAE